MHAAHASHPVVASVFLAALFCACVALVIPVSEKSSSQHEIKHLMSLLGKLKGAHRVRHPGQSFSAPEMALGSLADDIVDEDDVGDDVSAFASADSQQGGASVSKRQGAWSFDYGLGGGRFGKRYDYGLGGGRFGRDVDHVDPNHDVDGAL